MFPRNRSASVSLLSLVIAWKKGMRGMAVAQRLRWTSEAAARGPWAVMVFIVGGLQCILWPPHLGSLVLVLFLVINYNPPPSF